MEKISVSFENCYGIKSLNFDFDTSNGRVFLLYAPNGSMKTSFAKVFANVSRGVSPSDAIFPHRETKYSITDNNGNEISGDRIFVVEPYQESFNSTRTATLLVNQELRRQYESAVSSISEKADQVFKQLGELSQTKKGVQRELASAFGIEEKEILTLLEILASTLNQETDPGLTNIVYTEIFNDKVLSFLSLPDIRQHLQEYVERYDELISQSTYFRKGLFDHNNASNVGKSLKDNGFFNANHKVLLTGQNSLNIEITTQRDLDRVIAEEKQQILADPQLAKRFETIDKAITKNVELRQFRKFLENNPTLIPELLEIETLGRKLWISYAFVAANEFATFLSTYLTAKDEIAQVIERAKQEETEWRKVVSIFHERFSVPFTLEIVNQEDVILKNATPSLIFRYKDGDEAREIGREELLNVLSMGEKRALYLLNIIFDIQSRMKEPEETLLILDDIADSFDYKNKYAIIEYIKATYETSRFVIFVLTHNFDFYRTIQSRVNVHRNNCLMAFKSSERIVLKQAEYLNPFRYWRQVLNRNESICRELACDRSSCTHRVCNQKIFIATIPMVRNLIEYMHGIESEEYILLTSLLHIKDRTNEVTISELVNIVNRVLSTNIPHDSEKVLRLIYNQADTCSDDLDSVNLENKIILSIAIRLLAEVLMLEKIADPTIIERIKSNQTRELYNIYKEKFPGNNELNSLLEKVVLMTPETIHLNSFMYEPIIDLSDYHLRSIYADLKAKVAEFSAISV